MKRVQKQLESIARSIQALAQKVENIRKQMGSGQASKTGSKTGAAKRRTVKKAVQAKPSGAVEGRSEAADGGTAYALLLKTVEESENGISAADLKGKTGFNEKKIANLVYKAKKQGKIKTVGRGMYAKN